MTPCSQWPQMRRCPWGARWHWPAGWLRATTPHCSGPTLHSRPCTLERREVRGREGWRETLETGKLWKRKYSSVKIATSYKIHSIAKLLAIYVLEGTYMLPRLFHWQRFAQSRKCDIPIPKTCCRKSLCRVARCIKRMSSTEETSSLLPGWGYVNNWDGLDKDCSFG